MKNYLMLIALLLSLPAYAGEGHSHDHSENEKNDSHEETHSDSVEVTPEVAEASGIKLAKAENAIIQNKIKVNGSLQLNQNNTAKIKARFPGVVRSISKSVGDKVAVGETLATIESNESLQVYAVKSPISGVVMERNLNIGDEAAEEPIIIVADISKLWAEFYVFSKDSGNISEGQKVIISRDNGEQKVEATINTILPFAENSSQTVVARAVINNDIGWRAGYAIKAEIVVSEVKAGVAVKAAALQKLEGKDVIFVSEHGKFEARAVTIGNANDEWAEITEGVNSGEVYVADGSFVIKAEIGKSSAEHAH